MNFTVLDWVIIVGYLVFALGVGLVFARRAGKNVEQFFLSGRSLPWWLAGTSMVATTFASDTPLVITGWVRDYGIWQNWLWWCTAAGGMLTVFLFARYWRRGEVMTTAELAELRYGGREASVLRGFLGFYQAAITNTIILCWVILAAAKIMDVLFEVDKVYAVAFACALALTYSTMAGFWGVVVTDIVQFTMAMVGSITLAVVCWRAVGSEVLTAAAEYTHGFTAETTAFFPVAGDGGLFDASFWTINLVTVCVLLGVQWWANELVDGGTLAVQRISASRTERDSVLASLWYNIAHFALRPWPWILVALASMVVLPTIEVTAPTAGVVRQGEAGVLLLTPTSGDAEVEIRLADHAAAEDWSPDKLVVSPANADTVVPATAAARKRDAFVEAGEVLAKTDSERAYVVMMRRFLPAGILGLAVASLLAAFMSTVDTHVNLASSFFVNDIYRRFLKPNADDRHYVRAARISSAVVLALAGVFAWQANSISDLFTFFMAFLSGVGPIYVLRWLWWRVRASTEIVAILSSSVAATWLTFADVDWSGFGSFAKEGDLTAAGRLVLVVLFSGSFSLLSLVLFPARNPEALVKFYRRVRPIGWWGPVRALCPDVEPPREARTVLIGVGGGLLMIYGILFAVGGLFLERPGVAVPWGVAAVVGAFFVVRSLKLLR